MIVVEFIIIVIVSLTVQSAIHFLSDSTIYMCQDKKQTNIFFSDRRHVGIIQKYSNYYKYIIHWLPYIDDISNTTTPLGCLYTVLKVVDAPNLPSTKIYYQLVQLFYSICEIDDSKFHSFCFKIERSNERIRHNKQKSEYASHWQPFAMYIEHTI